MSFTAALNRQGTTAIIALEGDLDATTVAAFREKVEHATQEETTTLVLEMTKLAYISSAGLRGLVFARQKMAESVDVVLVGANADVEKTIRLVGFHHSVTFSDRIPE